MLRFKFVDLHAVNKSKVLYHNFFCISFNLTGKWNLDIDFFQILTYYNFPNFNLIEKCYDDN